MSDRAIQSVVRALLAVGIQPSGIADHLGPVLAVELIREGWQPPGPPLVPQPINVPGAAGVVIPPGGKTSASTGQAERSCTEAPHVQALAITPSVPPTVVTEAVAGPQGCPHRFGSGKWCALPTDHQPPHVPAANVGGA